MRDHIVGPYTKLSVRIDFQKSETAIFRMSFCMIIYDIDARSYTIRQESVTDLNVGLSDLGNVMIGELNGKAADRLSEDVGSIATLI